MHPQLQAIADELDTAGGRLGSLARQVPEESWTRRPDPARWSVAECVAHLNLTSLAFLPIIDDAIARAREIDGPAPRRYRRDPVGWLLWKSSGPPVRLRIKTTAAFVPTGDRRRGDLVTEFDRLQVELVGRVRRADGLRIDRVKVTSPFDARVRYNLYAALSILPRHQHRHLWQAEQVWLALGR